MKKLQQMGMPTKKKGDYTKHMQDQEKLQKVQAAFDFACDNAGARRAKQEAFSNKLSKEEKKDPANMKKLQQMGMPTVTEKELGPYEGCLLASPALRASSTTTLTTIFRTRTPTATKL